MFGIFAVIGSVVLFSGIAAIWKQQTQAGANALSSLATYVLSIPIFVLLGFWLYEPSDVQFSVEYIIYLLAWVIPVFAYSVGIIYLYKYQSLTELSAYNLALGVVLGSVVDILWLDSSYSIYTIFTVVLFFVSGLLLTKNRKIETSGLPLPLIFGIIFGVSAFQVLDFFLYKKAIALQGDPLLHILIAQVILISAFTLVGARYLVKHIKTGAVKWWQLLAIPTLFVPAVILEGLAINQLPIAIMITSAIIGILLHTLIDVYNKELHITFTTKIALILFICGVILLQIGAVL